MTGPDSDAWKARTSGRERVQMVVEMLEEPASVTAIADQADVAWGTAKSELERLERENRIQEHQLDGQTRYGPNPVRQFLDQVLELIAEHDRGELEAQLVEYQSRIEGLQDEHGVRGSTEVREQLTADDLEAAEMREIRNVASTWEALETERRLVKQALSFYDDVTHLSDSDAGWGAVPG